MGRFVGGTLRWWDPSLVGPSVGGTLCWWDPSVVGLWFKRLHSNSAGNAIKPRLTAAQHSNAMGKNISRDNSTSCGKALWRLQDRPFLPYQHGTAPLTVLTMGHVSWHMLVDPYKHGTAPLTVLTTGHVSWHMLVDTRESTDVKLYATSRPIRWWTRWEDGRMGFVRVAGASTDIRCRHTTSCSMTSVCT